MEGHRLNGFAQVGGGRAKNSEISAKLISAVQTQMNSQAVRQVEIQTAGSPSHLSRRHKPSPCGGVPPTPAAACCGALHGTAACRCLHAAAAWCHRLAALCQTGCCWAGQGSFQYCTTCLACSHHTANRTPWALQRRQLHASFCHRRHRALEAVWRQQGAQRGPGRSSCFPRLHTSTCRLRHSSERAMRLSRC